jgi:hypothetical protein
MIILFGKRTHITITNKDDVCVHMKRRGQWIDTTQGTVSANVRSVGWIQVPKKTWTWACSTSIPRQLHPLLKTMRVNLLRGPNTIGWHTDAFKGVTNKDLRIDDDAKSGPGPGFLSVNLSISFRCSVVRFKDSFYIPVSYSDATSTLRMVGFGNMAEASYEWVESCKNHATFYLFSSEVIHELIPYGNLPFAFVDLLRGSLQVV